MNTSNPPSFEQVRATRERMIDALVRDDINSITHSLMYHDREYLSRVLKGEGFVPYSKRTNAELTIECHDRDIKY